MDWHAVGLLGIGEGFQVDHRVSHPGDEDRGVIEKFPAVAAIFYPGIEPGGRGRKIHTDGGERLTDLMDDASADLTDQGESQGVVELGFLGGKPGFRLLLGGEIPDCRDPGFFPCHVIILPWTSIGRVVPSSRNPVIS